MSLKVELKPGEKLIIGSCVITNSDQRAAFTSTARPRSCAKRHSHLRDGQQPAKRIYFAVQLMYLDDNIEGMRSDYFSLVNDIVQAAPSCIGIIDQINNEIINGDLYKALRAAKRLIQSNRNLRKCSSRRRRPTSRRPANGDST